jgi:hypothetical protein
MDFESVLFKDSTNLYEYNKLVTHSVFLFQNFTVAIGSAMLLVQWNDGTNISNQPE